MKRIADFFHSHKTLTTILSWLVIIAVLSVFWGSLPGTERMQDSIEDGERFVIRYDGQVVAEVERTAILSLRFVEDWASDEVKPFDVDDSKHQWETISDNNQYQIKTYTDAEDRKFILAVQSDVECGILLQKSTGEFLLFNYESEQATKDIYNGLKDW